MTSCCCARKSALPTPSSRSGGPIFKCCRTRIGWLSFRRGPRNLPPRVRARPPAVGAAAGGAAERRALRLLAMTALWRPAYVAVGSNLDQPQARVAEAFARLALLSSTRLVLRSRLYETRPMGPQNQPNFINAAAGLLTQLTPRQVLGQLLRIEAEMGRNRQQRWGPRLIDLDLVWMVDGKIDEPGLTVPHPGVSTRNFVLYPLADIAPTLAIPGHGNVTELLRRAGGEGISILE